MRPPSRRHLIPTLYTPTLNKTVPSLPWAIEAKTEMLHKLAARAGPLLNHPSARTGQHPPARKSPEDRQVEPRRVGRGLHGRKHPDPPHDRSLPGLGTSRLVPLPHSLRSVLQKARRDIIEPIRGGYDVGRLAVGSPLPNAHPGRGFSSRSPRPVDTGPHGLPFDKFG